MYLDRVQLGIASDKDILNQSVCKVWKKTTTRDVGSPYDPNLGCTEFGELCVTCKKGIDECIGHFGHIELAVPVIIHLKECYKCLQVFCFGCGVYRGDIAKTSVCKKCKHPGPRYKYIPSDGVIYDANGNQLFPEQIKVAFSMITDEQVIRLGANPKLFHPKNLVINNLPVIPTRCRPKISTPEGMTSDDDLTCFLIEIIKDNNKIQVGTQKHNAAAVKNAVNSLRIKVRAYADNSKKKVLNVVNNHPLGDIKSRVCGKKGIVRENIMGKRREFCARTVIGPHMSDVDIVMVPQKIVDIMATEGFVVKENEYCIINRQPTLHKNSMLAFKMKFHPGNTLLIHLAVAEAFNADFDGDEASAFFHYGPEAQAELDLMSVQHNLFSFRKHDCHVSFIQDTLLAAHLMTRYPKPVKKSVAMDIAVAADITILYGPNFTTVDLLSACLPSDFTWQKDKLVIRDGRVSGWTTSASFKKKILREIACRYSSKRAIQFINQFTTVAHKWLSTSPFSLGLDDCFPDPKYKHALTSSINTSLAMAALAKSESELVVSLNNVRDAGMAAIRPYINNSGFIKTVEAGSKGTTFNIAQISGLMGQQYMEDSRPDMMLANGTKTLCCFDASEMDQVHARGFIKKSLISGLDPADAFFHAQAGREGIISTAIGTAGTGYLQRRIVKLLEDLVVKYNGAVCDSLGNIIQHSYGSFGMDPRKCNYATNGVPYPANAPRSGTHTIQPRDLYPAFKMLTPEIQQNVCQRLITAAPKFDIPEQAWKWYAQAMIPPGEAVGVVCGQTIGETNTQKTLNTFHKAGKLSESSFFQLETLLNIPKKAKTKAAECKVFFKRGQSLTKIKDTIGCKWQGTDIYHLFPNKKWDLETCYKLRITPDNIYSAIDEHVYVLSPDNVQVDAETPNAWIGGTGTVEYHWTGDEWGALTQNVPLEDILSFDLVDVGRIECADFQKLKEVFGIEFCREKLLQELNKTVGDLGDCHTTLLTDFMTYTGDIRSITRFTMRNAESGPLSKSFFEESFDNFIKSAAMGLTDPLQNASACIAVSKRPPIGTGAFSIMPAQRIKG